MRQFANLLILIRDNIWSRPLLDITSRYIVFVNFRLFPCAVLLSVGIFVVCKFSLIQYRKYLVFHLPFFIYHFTYHFTVPLFIDLTVDDFQNFPDNLLFSFCFANLVQYSVFDSEEAVVTGKLINLRYYVLHLLSNCFHLSTYIRREELLKFNIFKVPVLEFGNTQLFRIS